MRHQYRVTKFDPALRSEDGSFQGNEWTAHSDVGRSFDCVRLSEHEYLKVEAAYLFAVGAFLREAKIENLVLRSLKNYSDSELPNFLQSEANLSVAQSVEFARFALRGHAWGKLTDPGRAYVHFGYDYYLYLGLPTRCPAAIAEIQGRGLFVEVFRSPYLRARSSRLFQRSSNSKA